MPLNEADIREILRLSDESDVEELRIETDSLSLHVLRGNPERAEAVSAPQPPATETETGGIVTIGAPMIGTFYRAEAPGADPFVDVGSRVESGTVVEVCAENAEPVEYDTPLFRVEPGS